MKLYTGKIATIAEEMIRTLTADGDIEVGDAHEAQLDIEAILKEYVRLDRELTDKAKDLMEQRNLPYGQFGKLKRSMADEKQFALGDKVRDSLKALGYEIEDLPGGKSIAKKK